MGFLSRVFDRHGRPQEGNLAVIFVKIAKELAAVRETWFEGCIGAFEEAQTSNPPIDTRIVNRTFHHEVDLPIKAYQLTFVIPFLITSYFHRVKRGIGEPPPG